MPHFYAYEAVTNNNMNSGYNFFCYMCCTLLLQNLHSIIKILNEFRSSVTWIPCYTLLQVKENAQNVAPVLQHS
jgi:hypothetical protein